MALNPIKFFKLEKLRITAYRTADRGRRAKAPSEFEAMFNPASISRKYAIVWAKKQGKNTSGKAVNYERTPPETLALTLVLDGTGVDELGVLAIKSAIKKQSSVDGRIKEFLKVTFDYDGSMHQPRFLKVEWGSLIFKCRLESVDIKYTLFDRDGTALRAELAVNFISDEEAAKRAKKENKQSPDLTHSRIVVEGDSLPLLTREIYGSPEYYLRVARFNDLDDFRRLTPGTRLLFPPLEALTGGN